VCLRGVRGKQKRPKGLRARLWQAVEVRKRPCSWVLSGAWFTQREASVGSALLWCAACADICCRLICAGLSKVTRRKRQQQQQQQQGRLTQQREAPTPSMLLLPSAPLVQLWPVQPLLQLQAPQRSGQLRPAPAAAAAVLQQRAAGQCWKLGPRWWPNTGSVTRRSHNQQQQQQHLVAVEVCIALVAAVWTRVCLLLCHQSLQQQQRSAQPSARPTTACRRPERCQGAGWR
jgi:hypothetical protein